MLRFRSLANFMGSAGGGGGLNRELLLLRSAISKTVSSHPRIFVSQILEGGPIPLTTETISDVSVVLSADQKAFWVKISAGFSGPHYVYFVQWNGLLNGWQYMETYLTEPQPSNRISMGQVLKAPAPAPLATLPFRPRATSRDR